MAVFQRWFELWKQKKVSWCEIWRVRRLWKDSRRVFGQEVTDKKRWMWRRVVMLEHPSILPPRIRFCMPKFSVRISWHTALRYSLLQLPLELSKDDLNGWLHELLQHYRQFSTSMAVPNADHHQPKFGPIWNVSTTRTFESCPWLLPWMLLSTFQMSQ